MPGLIQPFKLLAREAGDAARAVLLRGALIAIAGLTAVLGIGFLLFAAYVGLRDLLGPGLAALVMGAALLVLAATLILINRKSGQRIKPIVPAGPLQEQPPHPATDAATTTVFVAAFLLGRQLSDRWGQSRNS